MTAFQKPRRVCSPRQGAICLKVSHKANKGDTEGAEPVARQCSDGPGAEWQGFSRETIVGSSDARFHPSASLIDKPLVVERLHCISNTANARHGQETGGDAFKSHHFAVCQKSCAKSLAWETTTAAGRVRVKLVAL